MTQPRIIHRRRNEWSPRRNRIRPRQGLAAMDYILVMAVILPLAAVLMVIIPRMVRLVYEFTVIHLGSPLM